MKLKENNTAPGFKLKDKDDIEYDLLKMKSKFIVLYFYPKDNTPGCTLEAIDFTNLKKEFSKQDCKIIGISGGNNKSKEMFCKKNNLDIILLSDCHYSRSITYIKSWNMNK